MTPVGIMPIGNTKGTGAMKCRSTRRFWYPFLPSQPTIEHQCRWDEHEHPPQTIFARLHWCACGATTWEE